MGEPTPPARKRRQVNIEDLPDYLRENVRVAPTGCWLWEGDQTEGYGRAYVPRPDGKKGHQVKAHRATYEALIGPIPAGLVIDHVCRVTLCVYPDPQHLEPVTQQENMRRSAVNGGVLYLPRPRPLVCKYGHAYTPENTRVTKRGHATGVQECRQCGRLRRWWTAAKKWEAEHYGAAA